MGSVEGLKGPNEGLQKVIGFGKLWALLPTGACRFIKVRKTMASLQRKRVENRSYNWVPSTKHSESNMNLGCNQSHRKQEEASRPERKEPLVVSGLARRVHGTESSRGRPGLTCLLGNLSEHILAIDPDPGLLHIELEMPVK